MRGRKGGMDLKKQEPVRGHKHVRECWITFESANFLYSVNIGLNHQSRLLELLISEHMEGSWGVHTGACSHRRCSWFWAEAGQAPRGILKCLQLWTWIPRVDVRQHWAGTTVGCLAKRRCVLSGEHAEKRKVWFKLSTHDYGREV